MKVLVKRSTRGTLAALVNLALAVVTAVVIIGNQIVAETAGVLWLIAAGLLSLWALLILSGLLRPVKLAADDTGLTVTRVAGQSRYRWEDLSWADFESSDRFALIAAIIDGKEQFAALSKRGLNAADLERAVAAIRTARPDLPTSRPATG